MKKFIIIIKGACLMSFVILILLSGCKGKAGDPGPNGTDGVNGTSGLDGVAYTEAVKNGHIKLVFEGTSSEGPFKDTVDFLFSPFAVERISEAEQFGPNNFMFYVKRYAGADFTDPNNDESQEDFIDMRFNHYIELESGEEVFSFNARVFANIVVQDHEFFNINESFYNDSGSTIEDEEFTDYEYNASEGSLKFNFNFVSTGEYNTTGNDMKITGIVDVKVYEYINPG